MLFGVGNAVRQGMLLWCALVVLSFSAHAQFFPSGHVALSYRLIGFEFPANAPHEKYTLEIAQGDYLSANDFASHIIQTVVIDTNRVILKVPTFGTAYTWRVLGRNKATQPDNESLQHFFVSLPPSGSAYNKRLAVPANAHSFPNAYILVDGSNAIYGTDGQPVWYFANKDSLVLESDAKVSPQGTITYISRSKGYEAAYDSRTLWNTNMAPRRLPAQDYTCHHGLERMANGNYMVLMASLAYVPEGPVSKPDKLKFFPSLSRSTLVEMDAYGKIVWSWESSKYVINSDLAALQAHFPQVPIDLHENAFCFSEKESAIYINMSGISRIVKIKYPTGKVLAEYGNIFKNEKLPAMDTSPDSGRNILEQFKHPLFGRQHALCMANDGALYIYNNMDPGMEGEADDEYPKVMKLKDKAGKMESVWEYDCKALVNGKSNSHGGGGNVCALPDSTVFVSMNEPFGNLFIVDEDKSIKWSAVFQSFDQRENKWKECPKYRAHIITQQQMERLIWYGR